MVVSSGNGIAIYCFLETDILNMYQEFIIIASLSFQVKADKFQVWGRRQIRIRLTNGTI